MPDPRPAWPAVRHPDGRHEPDRAPSHPVEAQDAGAEKARQGPALVLTERVVGHDDDDDDGHSGLDIVPRRLGQPALIPSRRRAGMVGALTLLVVVLGVGAGFAFVADGRGWSWPAIIGQGNEADVVQPDPDELLPARPAGGPGAPGGEADPSAIGQDALPPLEQEPIILGDTAALPGAEDEDAAPAGADGSGARPLPVFREQTRSIPIPVRRPPITSNEQATVAAATGDRLARVTVNGRPPDRLAPLFIGRVFVHYNAAEGEANREQAEAIIRVLEDEGYRIGDLRRAGFDIETSSVRYFFPEDRGAAERVREDLPVELAQRTRILDFTTYEPRPRPGTIELWIAGNE